MNQQKFGTIENNDDCKCTVKVDTIRDCVVDVKRGAYKGGKHPRGMKYHWGRIEGPFIDKSQLFVGVVCVPFKPYYTRLDKNLIALFTLETEGSSVLSFVSSTF